MGVFSEFSPRATGDITSSIAHKDCARRHISEHTRAVKEQGNNLAARSSLAPARAHNADAMIRQHADWALQLFPGELAPSRP
jgi:hypothetical protein